MGVLIGEGKRPVQLTLKLLLLIIGEGVDELAQGTFVDCNERRLPVANDPLNIASQFLLRRSAGVEFDKGTYVFDLLTVFLDDVRLAITWVSCQIHAFSFSKHVKKVVVKLRFDVDELEFSLIEPLGKASAISVQFCEGRPVKAFR